MEFEDMRIGIDMQSYYDDLLLLRKSIDAQVEILEKEPSICTHKETEIVEADDKELVICSNCQKVVEGDIDLRPY